MDAKVTIAMTAAEYADLMDVFNEAKYLFHEQSERDIKPVTVRDDKDYVDLAIIAQKMSMLLED